MLRATLSRFTRSFSSAASAPPPPPPPSSGEFESAAETMHSDASLSNEEFLRHFSRQVRSPLKPPASAVEARADKMERDHEEADFRDFYRTTQEHIATLGTMFTEDTAAKERPQLSTAAITEMVKKRARDNAKDRLFDPLNLAHLSRYLSAFGTIKSRKLTHLTAKEQRQMNKAVRRARHMGFMSFKKKTFTIISPFADLQFERSEQGEWVPSRPQDDDAADAAAAEAREARAAARELARENGEEVPFDEDDDDAEAEAAAEAKAQADYRLSEDRNFPDEEMRADNAALGIDDTLNPEEAIDAIVVDETEAAKDARRRRKEQDAAHKQAKKPLGKRKD